MEFLEFKGKLGQGGFGSVYLAWDLLYQREVAVKVISYSEHPTLMNKEIEALKNLNHKHIVTFYHSFPLPKKQQIIVVMEYLKGGELFDFWNSRPHGRLPEYEAKEVML